MMSKRLDPELVSRTLEVCRKTRTIDEIAMVLGVSRVTVYNWLSGKSVPYRKERMSFIRLCEDCKMSRLANEWKLS